MIKEKSRQCFMLVLSLVYYLGNVKEDFSLKLCSASAR